MSAGTLEAALSQWDENGLVLDYPGIFRRMS
jgi:hypothetical protein